MTNLSKPGGRFYRFALWLAGPPVWIVSIGAAVQIVNGETVDYEALGFGVAAIISAVGLGSGVNKMGSAQQRKAERPELGEE